MNNFSTWLTALMLVIFSTMLVIAFQYPPGARMMPFVIGVPGALLCVLQLVLDARSSATAGYRFKAAPKAGKRTIEDEMAAAAAAAEAPEFGPQTVGKELTMWTYFVTFIAGILLFGFYIAVPVMLVTFLRREAEASWGRALGLGLGGTLILYLMFGALLKIRLHPGFITPTLMGALGF